MDWTTVGMGALAAVFTAMLVGIMLLWPPIIMVYGIVAFVVAAVLLEWS